MICNKVLIALAALLAVTAAMPWFPIGDPENEERFENQYIKNSNAPLKAKPQLKWGEWNQPQEQQASEYEAPDSEVDSEVESEVESEYEGADLAGAAVAGGKTNSAETGAFGQAFGAAAFGGAGAFGAAPGTGNMAGAGAPVVAEDHAGAHSVHAAGGPAPGELKAGNSKVSGLGIAIGVCLLVGATTAVAVFAIRRYWRHRL